MDAPFGCDQSILGRYACGRHQAFARCATGGLRQRKSSVSCNQRKPTDIDHCFHAGRGDGTSTAAERDKAHPGRYPTMKRWCVASMTAPADGFGCAENSSRRAMPVTHQLFRPFACRITPDPDMKTPRRCRGACHWIPYPAQYCARTVTPEKVLYAFTLTYQVPAAGLLKVQVSLLPLR